MATKKISEFTTLGSLSDTDILPVVSAGSNKKITGATLKTYAQSGLTIPTDVSDLTDTTSLLGGGTTLPANASGYLTNDGSGNLSWAAGDGTFSGNYTDLTNKPTIPTDVSDLTDTTSLLGGSGGVGTLDSVTDTGSTTTNSITVGSVSLTNGSTITETSTTTVITPPGALAGQSLVIRPTGVQGIVSDHPGGFTDGDTITITVTPDYSYAAVTGTVDYTFTGCTSIQLGRALTGTLTFNNESAKPITWTIPVSSTMTTFTVTLSNESGFSIGGLISPLTLTRSGSSEDHHVHLIAGDPTITDIYLGDDDQYVKIEKNGGNVVIGTDTNTNQWTFGTDGDLVLPAGGDIKDSTGASVLGGGSGPTNEITNTSPEGPTYSVSVGTDGVVTMVTSRGNLEFGALPEPGGPTHFHIMRPAGDNGTDLYFGDDYNYVLQRPSAYGGAPAYGVEIGSHDNAGGGQHVWRFETNGLLTFPRNSDPETTTDPILTIKGGEFPEISSVVSEQTGPADLAIVANNLNISGYNGYKVKVNADSGTISFDNNGAVSADVALVLSTNQMGSPFNWTFSSDGKLQLPTNGIIQQNGSYTRTTTPGINGATTNDVVWTSLYNDISSAKLTIQLETNEVGDTTGWHTQVCEAIIASRGAIPGGDPVITVYGVTYTSTVPLATFTVQRNPTTQQIEVVATRTASTAEGISFRINSVEMKTRD